MSGIVRPSYRDKRPPRWKQPAVLDVPVTVTAIDPAKIIKASGIRRRRRRPQAVRRLHRHGDQPQARQSTRSRCRGDERRSSLLPER
jgi:hypothetical protein